MVEDLCLICGGCCDCRSFEGLLAWAIDFVRGFGRGFGHVVAGEFAGVWDI